MYDVEIELKQMYHKEKDKTIIVYDTKTENMYQYRRHHG